MIEMWNQGQRLILIHLVDSIIQKNLRTRTLIVQIISKLRISYLKEHLSVSARANGVEIECSHSGQSRNEAMAKAMR